MTDPLDKLKQWRHVHNLAQSPHADGFAVAGERRFKGMALEMVGSLLDAIENVLKIEPCGPECGCNSALDEVRDAIRDALGGTK